MEKDIRKVLDNYNVNEYEAEKITNELLNLHSVRLSFDEVKRLLYLAVKNSEKSKEVEGIYYSNDLKELDEYESLVKKYLGDEA